MKSARVLIFSAMLMGCEGPALLDEASVEGKTQEVVGGTVAQDEPNVFYLRSKHPTTLQQLGLCTATLISKKVLLTAAHCVSTFGKPFVPKYFVGNTVSEGQGTEYEVSQVHVHPAYVDNGQVVPHDIALLLLSQEIQGITPANLPQQDLGNIVGTSIRVLGYGLTGYYQNDTGTKRVVNATITPSNSNIMQDFFGYGISENQPNAHGVCPGDSGGPSFASVQGLDTVIGVHSYIYWGSGSPKCGKSADVRVDRYYASFIAPFLDSVTPPGPATRLETSPADKKLRLTAGSMGEVSVMAFDANNRAVTFDSSAWTTSGNFGNATPKTGKLEVVAATQAAQFPKAIQFSKDGMTVEFDVEILPEALSTLTLTPVPNVTVGSTTQLELSAQDEFGNEVAPNVSWSFTAGNVSLDGEFTAPLQPGTVQVTASQAGISTSLSIEVKAATQPVAPPSTSTGKPSTPSKTVSTHGNKAIIMEVVGGCSHTGGSSFWAMGLWASALFLARRRSR